MKKVILLSALFCGIAFNSNAQTTNLPEEKKTEIVTAETPAKTSDASVSNQKSDTENKSLFASTREEINKNRAKKNKKDLPSFQDKPLYYIGAGIFIAVVVVLYVVTDGEGISSR